MPSSEAHHARSALSLPLRVSLRSPGISDELAFSSHVIFSVSSHLVPVATFGLGLTNLQPQHCMNALLQSLPKDSLTLVCLLVALVSLTSGAIACHRLQQRLLIISRSYFARATQSLLPCRMLDWTTTHKIQLYPSAFRSNLSGPVAQTNTFLGPYFQPSADLAESVQIDLLRRQVMHAGRTCFCNRHGRLNLLFWSPQEHFQGNMQLDFSHSAIPQ